jgi:pimeloyl-ACP methyl ester carboxylesterase
MLSLIIPISIPILLVFIAFVVTHREYCKYFHIRGRESTQFYEYFLSQYPELKARPFSCPSGKETLRGVQLYYNDKAKGLIVMVHGFGWNMEHYFPQAEYLARAGYCIILFDGMGMGRSTGTQIHGLPQHMMDVSAVLDYIQSMPALSPLPLMLYGHSWGGYAADAVPCEKYYPIRAILSVAAYNEPMGAMEATLRAQYGVWNRVLILPLFLYQRAAFGRRAGYSAVRGLSLVDCPVLLLHSRDDRILSFQDNFEKIKKALGDKPNIQFWDVEGSNHNLGIPGEVNEKRQELQRRIRQTTDPDGHLQQELWDLQMIVDETILNKFLDFYDQSLPPNQNRKK